MHSVVIQVTLRQLEATAWGHFFYQQRCFMLLLDAVSPCIFGVSLFALVFSRFGIVLVAKKDSDMNV